MHLRMQKTTCGLGMNQYRNGDEIAISAVALGGDVELQYCKHRHSIGVIEHSFSITGVEAVLRTEYNLQS